MNRADLQDRGSVSLSADAALKFSSAVNNEVT